ncbi:MAG: SAM-dependent chlorinase/fluorinase [Deltaproteobacteria bacterium]|nr:SAM-dependent chlorinase/fluorinase [Deltaproteobacteria bacterium]
MCRYSVFIFFSLVLGACSHLSSQQSSGGDSRIGGPAPIVLMSDFGSYDDGIGICKGAMLKIQSGLTIVDITHQIPAFSVKDAARFLVNSTPHFPQGTVFVVLVEKNVGKTRAIVAKSKKGQYFVLSDNGALTLVAEQDGIEKVRAIRGDFWVEGKGLDSTFLGRDVYAPIAARIARGDNWEVIGPEISDVHLFDKKSRKFSEDHLIGDVIALDGPFGNLITDITAAAFLNSRYFLGDKVKVIIGQKEFILPFVKTFSDVPANQNLIYIDSTEHVAVAINEGNFARRYKIKVPTKFTVITKKEK